MGQRSFIVEDEFEGQRVDAFLAQVSGESRAHIQELISSSLVEIRRGKRQFPAKKSSKLEVGEEVFILGELTQPEKPAPPEVPIVFSNDDIIVVNKPAGLAVHDGAGVRVATLVDALVAQGIPSAGGPEEDRPGVVHRIDRDTSGLLALARTQKGYDTLRPQFSDHSTHREYWAMVQGKLEPSSVTIDAPILRSTSNRTTFTTGDKGRPSVTHVSSLSEHQIRVGSEFRDVSQVIITLETGRTHQVRVHLRALNHPLIADEQYGADMRLAKFLKIERQALHARRLAFFGVNGERIDLEADVPQDLTRVIPASI